MADKGPSEHGNNGGSGPMKRKNKLFIELNPNQRWYR